MSSLEAKAKVDNYDDEIYGDMLLRDVIFCVVWRIKIKSIKLHLNHYVAGCIARDFFKKNLGLYTA